LFYCPKARSEQLVQVANRRDPRASRSALTSDGAAREVACLPTWAWSCRYWHARCDRRRLEQAGAPLLAQPVAVAADRDDVAVMEQAVEDRMGHDGIAEHGALLADRPIAGHQYAAPLVAPRHQLNKQMCRIGLEMGDNRARRRSEVSACRSG